MTAPTYRAVLIANSTFPADRRNLPDLEGPRNDPALLRDALCDRDVGLFLSDNVRLVTERTMAEVLGEAEDLLASATRRDTLLVYYSGHGVLDQSGELFLCTRDTRSDRLRSSAVKASDLRGMMDASAAGAMVVVLDCCHSGRFKGGDIPATLSGRGRFVMTSSRPGELANDATARNRASLFTHHLTEGLLHGAEDRDGDGVVTLDDLYDYVRAVLLDEGRHVPQKRFEGDGDIALARRATPDATVPPGEIVDPTQAAPALDVSETSIHLGEIGDDEQLPPERVAVINRGGGTLDWTVESTASWLDAVAEDNTVVLHLRPRPGSNRANVYVREAGGALKTIRVSVRVRAAAVAEPRPEPEPEASQDPNPGPEREAPPASVLPASAPEPGPAAVDEHGTPPPGVRPPKRWADLRWWTAALSVFGWSMGMAIITSISSLVDHVDDDTGYELWLRRQHHGGPFLAEAMAGGALMAVGTVALVRLVARRLPERGARRTIGCTCALAVPWTLFLIGDTAAIRHTDGDWLVEEVSLGFVCLWMALLAALSVLAMFRTGTWARGTWAPHRLHGAAIAAAVLWTLSLLVEPYTREDQTYGSVVRYGTAATTWYLLAGLSIVALVHVGFRYVDAPVGTWLLAATATTPLLMLFTELAYLGSDAENPDSALRLGLPAAPTLTLAGIAIATVIKTHRVPAAPPIRSPEAPSPPG